MLNPQNIALKYHGQNPNGVSPFSSLRNFYDTEKEMYFEGLNSPTPDEMIYEFLPQNVEKRYYTHR